MSKNKVKEYTDIRLRRRETTMQGHFFTGRIAGLVIFRVPEFGTRASFTIEEAGRCPIVCAVEGDVAREFIARYCEGDTIAVRGIYEPRPSTAAANTPWVARFRVREVRTAEDARLVHEAHRASALDAFRNSKRPWHIVYASLSLTEVRVAGSGRSPRFTAALCRPACSDR
jgi:hypothetical protein